jgi:hypothetical protein
MPCRRGISTVLGALLFTIVAVLFVALTLRTFTESASTLTEVANVNLQNAVVENLQISLSRTSTKLTASQASASVTPLYGTGREGGETLLDALDRKSLNVTSTAPLGGAAQAVQQLQLVKNGDFSEGSRYWTLEKPWNVTQQYARAQVSTNTDFAASIYQDVEIPAGATNLTLSFSYYLAADSRGQVEKGRLTLKAYLLSGGNVVWESSTIQWDGSRAPVWRQFTQTFTVNVTGKVTLKITLTANVKEVGAPASIDAGLDNVSLVAVVPVAVPSPVGAAVAAAKVALGSAGASANCTLTMALNATGFVEVYAPAASGAWVMVSKYYVERGYAWFNATFRGNSALVYAYSAQPFKLMMDYLQVAQPSQSVNVVVANLGTAPVTVYAVWLNGSRIQVEQVLAPGDLLSVPFDLGSSGSALEVRVVTSTRAHVARFATKSAAP